MSDHTAVTTSTFVPPSVFATTTTSIETALDSTPSSSPSSLPSSTLSSLFPGLEIADHFLPDDVDDDYYGDFSDIPQEPLSNLSSSSSQCISINDTSILSSMSSDCPNVVDLTKIKIYSPEDLWAENEIYAIKLAPAMAFIALLMIIGIFGNILVVYVYGFKFKSATQHFLIVCLACFDLVMCLVAMPAEIADIRFHHTFTSVFACKLLRFVTMFASISSSFTLVTVAYDRHRRITRPLSKQISMQQARVWMLSNMFAALCFSWPTLVLTGIRSSETRIPGLSGTDCSFSERFKKTKYPLAYNAVLGFGFFTMITVIAVFYFRIWKTAKTRKINMAKRYTISSLSDQFMNELKLQRQISKDGMSDILSKQLEKCVREKLQTKPSIDCKDIYYFFENNSIRSTIGNGIAKKRGRYRGFSMSSSDDSPKNSDESSVLGQSFSYRTSVNCRRKIRGGNGEEKDNDKNSKIVEISRNRRYVGRASSKLSKQSFSMAKIPENVSSSCKDFVNIQVHEKVTSNQSHISKEDNSVSQTEMNKTNTNNDGENFHQNEEYITHRSKIPCQKSRSNSPFLQYDENDAMICATSPSLSLKSACSPMNSPGRYRRNSSPLIGQRRHRVKAKVENSISIISDEFRPRPMSSLVDSVSQTLGRMQAFSDFETYTKGITSKLSYEINSNITMIHGPRQKIAEVDDNVYNVNENDNQFNEEVNSTGSLRKCHDQLHNSNDTESEFRTELNTSDETICKNKNSGTKSFDDIAYLNNNNEQICDTGKISALEQDQSSTAPDNTQDETLFIDNIDENMSSFKSFSHLICTSKPIEIPFSCNDVTNSKCVQQEIDNVIQNDDYGSGHLNSDNALLACKKFNCVDFIDRDCTENVSDNRQFSQDKKNINDNIIRKETHRHNSKDLLRSTSDCSKSCTDGVCQNKTNSTNLTQNASTFKRNTNILQNGLLDGEQSLMTVSSSTTAATTSSSLSPPATSTTSTACDLAEVQTRNKPRSFSNSSLDGLASESPRRRKNNSSGCICISQNLDKTTVVAFTVSSVFILSFLPFLILMFIRGLVKDFDYSLDGATLCIYHIFLRFYFLNSAINPFLYGLLNVNFRYECVHTWKKITTCCYGNDKTQRKKDPAIC